MFNDTLNVEQCERLLAQLSDTAFPFQCAHGRYVHPTWPKIFILMSMLLPMLRLRQTLFGATR